jgi:CCR4-NOT transcriptional regulation complex NOT5 subunit
VKEPINPVPIGTIEEFLFPTVPMFTRKENFAKFDIDTLFFIFYY